LKNSELLPIKKAETEEAFFGHGSPGFERNCPRSAYAQMAMDGSMIYPTIAALARAVCQDIVQRTWRGIKPSLWYNRKLFSNVCFHYFEAHDAVFYSAGPAATDRAEPFGAKMRPYCQTAEIISPDRTPVSIAASAIPTGG